MTDSGADREAVRLAVYESFRRTGRLDVACLGETTGLAEADVVVLLRELERSRDVVLGAGDAVVMAHPFSAHSLGFSVMSETVLWWGGCAWDSFAIPALVPEVNEVVVATTCPGCGSALAWVVNDQHPPAGAEVAHFLTPAAHIWDDVVHACAHQRIFCDEVCVEEWLTRSGNSRGYVMTLPTLWNLARGWYAGRLEPGYIRRDPSEAREYFAGVGLHGAFWGLPARPT